MSSQGVFRPASKMLFRALDPRQQNKTGQNKIKVFLSMQSIQT